MVPVFPTLSARYWWEGALEYINPKEKSYQRSFLLFIACIASLGHEFEKVCSYDWSSSVRLNAVSKVLVSASNYWRIYDLTDGLKGAVESLDVNLQESIFKVMRALSSAALLVIDLSGRGALEGIPINTLKLYGGIAGAAVYFRKTLLTWNEMGTPSEERRQVRLEARRHIEKAECLRDSADTVIYLSIFIIKMIGLTVLTASASKLRIVRAVLDYQSKWLLGCFTLATGAAITSHYADYYIDLYVDLNRREG